MFFRHLGGRFRAYLGSRDAFRAPAKHRFLRLKFRNFGVTDRPPVFQVSGFVSNSFCVLNARIESHSKDKHTKNTNGPNEFTDFEKFAIEHPAGGKTIRVSISAQRPGTGITVQLAALRSMCIGGPALSRATGRAGKICLGARKRPLRPNFSIFQLQRKLNCRDKNVEILAPWDRTLFRLISAVANSFCDLTRRIESLDHRNL